MNKYEYSVTVWGEYFSDERKAAEEGTYFFESEKNKDHFVNVLKEHAESINKHVCWSPEEGVDVRHKPVVYLVFEYDNKTYNYVYERFNYGYLVEAAIYMFEDGNYSCDCNRSSFLRERYPDFPELDCGDEIKLVSMNIVMVKCPDDVKFIATC